MQKHLIRLVALLTLVVLQSCGSVRFMRQPEPGEERLAAPPAGQALVNFYRPSNYGGGQEYPIFDRQELIGNTVGKTLFQYVCDPGQHVFIAAADRATVVQADVAADQVYDVVLNISMGVWKANVTMDPLVQGHDKRGEIADWDRRSRLYIFADDDRARSYESQRAEWAAETMADFTSGDKSDRLKIMKASDHR